MSHIASLEKFIVEQKRSDEQQFNEECYLVDDTSDFVSRANRILDRKESFFGEHVAANGTLDRDREMKIAKIIFEII